MFTDAITAIHLPATKRCTRTLSTKKASNSRNGRAILGRVQIRALNQRVVMDKAKLKAELEAVCKKHGTFLTSGIIAGIISDSFPRRYTQEQLEDAFKAVQPPRNWKNAIDARVYLDDAGVELTREAIIHFTGGGAMEFAPVPGIRKVNGKTMYRVTAPGYYVIIGA